MASTTTMSPTKAILICINSMVAAGLFINVCPLTKLAGPFGFVGYAIAAVILLPLILSIAELARLHPVAGGLFVYSNTYLGSWAGFISAWAYFVGKTTSAAVLMNTFVKFFQARIPAIQTVPTLLIDFVLIFTVVALNSAGVSVGGRVQYLFTFLKSLPIIFTFGVGFMFFDINLFVGHLASDGLLDTLPIAVFALLGFEVICAIGNMIDDAANNIKRVIITSFLIVTAVDILFQFVMVGSMGLGLATISEPVLALGTKALGTNSVIASMLNGAVFAAIIGSCFSILTSNCWNLYTLAKHKLLPGTRLLTKINRFNVPWVSLLVEATLGCTILWITADQIPLQKMSVFAQIISYLISSLAAGYAVYSGATKRLPLLIPILASVSCAYIMNLSLRYIIAVGVSLPFLAVFVIGGVATVVQRMRTTTP
jgi:amino acid transporter